MSTYYSLVCDKHLERVDACSRNAGGIGQSPVGDSAECLGPFIVTHCGCPVRIISEHHDDWSDEKFLEWTAENVEKLYALERPEENETGETS